MKTTVAILNKYPPIFWAVAFIILTGNSAHAQLPKAISLDYCADQYLLALGDKSQIMALSKNAVRQPSFYEKKAKALKKINVNTEELLVMKPDVVIATDSAFAILPALKHYNINTIKAGYDHERQEIYNNYKHFGAALKRSDQAELIINDYKKRWAALKNLSHENIKVAYITPSGFTAGAGTFVNDIIKLAGFNSLAQENGMIGWLPISLELLLINPPDLIITGFFDRTDVHVSYWSLSRHPKINQMMNEIPTISLPSNLLSCNGQFAIEAAEYIRKEAGPLLQGKSDNEP